MFNSKARAELGIGIQSTNHNHINDPILSTLQYQTRLNFYSQPPTTDITIDQFETWAINRLKVLAEIENSLSRNRSFEELKPILINRCKECLPLSANTAKSVDLDSQRKIDHYSHYILRLAFCRSEELRSRFVNAETLLFKFRFETEDTLERIKFIPSLKIDWQQVDQNEVAHIKTMMKDPNEDTYYKVRWTKVPDLVSSRKVYLKAGYAYVSSKDQASIIFQEFSSRLKKALEITSKHLPYLDEDSRLLPVLEHLSLNFLAGISGSQYIARNPSDPDSTVFTAEMIDGLAKQHFPPCMRHLWSILRKDKHLKYGGRQQFNLFLKGVGLPVDEALIFWRKAFCNVSDDKFRKDYRYGFRHNYGLEGSRKNYQPMPCTTIIKNGAGPSDHHGCPFKQFTPINLTQFLTQSYGLPSNSNELKDIANWNKSSLYHLSCTCVFEFSHKKFGIKKGQGLGQGESVSHPNRYFEVSHKLSHPPDEGSVKPT
ncbi:eukaryotic and archaeal DNA primase, large subunit-domain-containing protein [Melampsora americana]|nr:eukaryotic and archaeal DNA primase, large subunit-domain-containing protein [Melampsora americana]